MECRTFSRGLVACLDDSGLTLSGDLDHHNGAQLLDWLPTLPLVEQLHADELELLDGVAVTHAVNAVRQLLERTPRLQLVGAPQVLGHTLYRCGMLEQGRVELQAMREDEAYG